MLLKNQDLLLLYMEKVMLNLEIAKEHQQKEIQAEL